MTDDLLPDFSADKWQDDGAGIDNDYGEEKSTCPNCGSEDISTEQSGAKCQVCGFEFN